MSMRRMACLGLIVFAATATTACSHPGGAEPPGSARTGSEGEAMPDVPMLPMEIVTAKTLNVRAIPSTKGTVIGTLKKGAEVRVLETKNGWKKVQSDGAAPEGWVAGEYLKAHGAK